MRSGHDGFRGPAGLPLSLLRNYSAPKSGPSYQRRKGRDLFDLWRGLAEGKAEASEVIQNFKEYMKAQGFKVKQEDFEKNIQEKIKHRGFISDLTPPVSTDVSYDIQKVFDILKQEVISRI